jgi:hypothetical protein
LHRVSRRWLGICDAQIKNAEKSFAFFYNALCAAAPAIVVESPVLDFVKGLLAEEATKGSHRRTINLTKDKQAWNGKREMAPK